LHVAKGVIVDDRMRTSDPTVFAVGDVAEYQGTVPGLWPTGVEQAEIAAENVVGGDRSYKGTLPLTMLKVVGFDMLSCGRFEAQDHEDELIIHEDESAKTYMKFVIRNGRLHGATLLGHAPAASGVSAAVRNRSDVSAILYRLRIGDLDALASTQILA
jgi:nitrite reductase (NADH) large subunit